MFSIFVLHFGLLNVSWVDLISISRDFGEVLKFTMIRFPFTEYRHTAFAMLYLWVQIWKCFLVSSTPNNQLLSCRHFYLSKYCTCRFVPYLTFFTEIYQSNLFLVSFLKKVFPLTMEEYAHYKGAKFFEKWAKVCAFNFRISRENLTKAKFWSRGDHFLGKYSLKRCLVWKRLQKLIENPPECLLLHEYFSKLKSYVP